MIGGIGIIRFIKGRSSQAKTFDDLFLYDNLIGDTTQKVLLPYIYETKLLLDAAISQYDKNGYANIIPALDLGFSYNVGRLAGGFTTGMVVDWSCEVPFVPIDMTLKECSGSVIELGNIENPLKYFSAKNVTEALEKLKNSGFLFNFNSGNHFISLFKDKKEIYYLVVHSGDDGYRNSEKGVYPVESVWYEKEIKTVYNRDKTRYLKYLVDSAAQRFIDFALLNRANVENFHITLADRIFPHLNNNFICNTYQHYGLHSEHTAVLGTGLVCRDSVYPIFSNQGLPIVIASPSRDMWSIEIDKNEYYVFPHGWGQEIKGVTSVYNNLNSGCFNIEVEKSLISEKIDYSNKLPKNIASVRNLCNYMDLIEGKIPFERVWNNQFYASVEKVLYPVAAYINKNQEVIVY